VGLGAPHWDPYARGLLVGITRGTTQGHIARAVIESIGYQTRDVIEAMEKDSGITLKELRCDGGASVDNVLMQFQSDILGVPVEVPRIIETTALGAAYLAGLATGFWESREELAEKWQLANRYEPNIDKPTREHLFKRWHNAVERSKGWALDED
jgi:glycerol kinase